MTGILGEGGYYNIVNKHSWYDELICVYDCFNDIVDFVLLLLYEP